MSEIALPHYLPQIAQSVLSCLISATKSKSYTPDQSLARKSTNNSGFECSPFAQVTESPANASTSDNSTTIWHLTGQLESHVNVSQQCPVDESNSRQWSTSYGRKQSYVRTGRTYSIGSHCSDVNVFIPQWYSV